MFAHHANVGYSLIVATTNTNTEGETMRTMIETPDANDRCSNGACLTCGAIAGLVPFNAMGLHGIPPFIGCNTCGEHMIYSPVTGTWVIDYGITV